MSRIVNSERQRRVWIVDDARMEAEEYERALKSVSAYDVDVEICRSASDAIDKLATAEGWDVILLDMMMPVGVALRDETGDGLFTGIVIAKHIRARFPGVPIVLLSNATFAEVRDACIKTEARVENCMFCVKSQMPPRELASLLDKYFEEGRVERPSRSRLKRVFGAMILQPNFAGFGLDLKKLGKSDDKWPVVR